MSTEKRAGTRPNLSVLALVSFISSFLVARAFTTLNPNYVLIGGGFHIHHFWYGLAMLAVGGWLGISYHSERIDRVAAILFGVGGGLIGDEVGLLLTLGDYWTEITYTLIIVFLALASISILIFRYLDSIRDEFARFLRSHRSLYFGVFLAAVSIAFIAETSHPTIIAIASLTAIIACIIILAYFIQRNRKGVIRSRRVE
ncbi:MAG TPA: hypothetical protein VJ574_07480 [Candidatus Bathyarchaeia archaeon]|nr:MAG: hypothetical protein A3K70_00505 [Candidatus Bathyarchaeota archaeon RBG_16_48_13]HJX24223.1 hypothetical protein [Candidatus Bathyarchaeia archaeon]